MHKFLEVDHAMSQIMVEIVEMVRHFTWTKDPEYHFQTTTASFYKSMAASPINSFTNIVEGAIYLPIGHN